MDAAASILAGHHNGNQSAAAEAFGVSRQAVSQALRRIAARAAKVKNGKAAPRRKPRPDPTP